MRTPFLGNNVKTTQNMIQNGRVFLIILAVGRSLRVAPPGPEASRGAAPQLAKTRCRTRGPGHAVPAEAPAAVGARAAPAEAQAGAEDEAGVPRSSCTAGTPVAASPIDKIAIKFVLDFTSNHDFKECLLI